MSSDSISRTSDDRRASSLPPPRPIESGSAGAAVEREDRRRGSTRPDSSHSLLRSGAGRVISAPRSAGRWVRGAFAERRLGNRLDRELGPVAVVLHARQVPGTAITIDHIVVASSGVWVVVADHSRGRVRRRRVGRRARANAETIDSTDAPSTDRPSTGTPSTEQPTTGTRSPGAALVVGGDERPDLIDGAERRAAAVRSVLYPIGFEWMDVHRAVCFTNANFRMFTRPFTIDGAWAIRARGLVDRVAVPGPVDPDVMRIVGVELSSRLPAVR